MLYMIVEHFGDNATAVYQRFRENGRMAPDGLTYVSSFVSTDYRTCYQLMETDKRELLDQWAANWKDLVSFEVIPVVTSAEAYQAILPRLGTVKP
jgi:hypothetical protein